MKNIKLRTTIGVGGGALNNSELMDRPKLSVDMEEERPLGVGNE